MQISNVKALIESQKRKKLERTWLPRIHHVLMKEYGWISYDEFKRLPLPMMWQLFGQIEEQRKFEKEEMNKSRMR